MVAFNSTGIATMCSRGKWLLMLVRRSPSKIAACKTVSCGISLLFIQREWSGIIECPPPFYSTDRSRTWPTASRTPLYGERTNATIATLAVACRLRGAYSRRSVTQQENNKGRIRDLLAAVDAGDLEGTLTFYSRDYYDHDASEARAGVGAHAAGLRHAFAAFYAAFTGTRHSIEDLVAEGDRVVARISVEARHTGEIMGIPGTGKVIQNESIVIYRFENGHIIERWCRERHSTRALLEAAARAAALQ